MIINEFYHSNMAQIDRHTDRQTVNYLLLMVRPYQIIDEQPTATSTNQPRGKKTTLTLNKRNLNDVYRHKIFHTK